MHKDKLHEIYINGLLDMYRAGNNLSLEHSVSIELTKAEEIELKKIMRKHDPNLIKLFYRRIAFDLLKQELNEEQLQEKLFEALL